MQISLKCDLDRLRKMEEICWAQKAKENWLRLGDRNTRFFHRIANAKCRFNSLNRMVVNGIDVHGQHDLKIAVVDFYKTLYTDPIKSRPFPIGLTFSSISTKVSESLVAPFRLEET
ncbi:hypothetical protein LINPERPRIM_LOCUS21605 [Linum perenne]